MPNEIPRPLAAGWFMKYQPVQHAGSSGALLICRNGAAMNTHVLSL